MLSRAEDDPSGPVEWKKVEELFRRFGFMIHLHIGGQVIRTTVEHPFYVMNKGWVTAAELKTGDLLSSHDGQWIPVEEVYDTGDYEEVYNLRVADFQTYFVGGEDWGFSVWAHNKCAWQLHEDDVTAALGAASKGEQITIRVTNTATGQVRRIRIDNLVDAGGGAYSLVDAKFSAVRDLTFGSLTSTLTKNQKDVYGWIKSGKSLTFEGVGGNAAAVGVNKVIPVVGPVQIHVNGPARIVPRIY